MRKMLLWEKILIEIKTIETNLKSPELNQSQNKLEYNKKIFLYGILEVIKHVGNGSTERSRLKMEAYLSRGINRKETASRLNMSTDGLRATINNMNARLEHAIGKDTLEKTVACKSQEELEKVEKAFWSKVSTIKSGYFR